MTSLLTQDITRDDLFVPVHQLPASLKKMGKKNPIPFPGPLPLLEHFVHLKTMDPERGQRVIDMFYKTFRFFYEQLENVPRGYERGMALFAAMDLVTKDSVKTLPKDKKISCSKGCSHCCHMRVSVSDSEAVVLASHIKRLKIPLDRTLTEGQARQRMSAFMELGWERRRCPLLSDKGECRAYEWRPSSCRKYAVVSDPVFCDSRIHKMADLVSDIKAEALTAAMLVLDEPYPTIDRGMADQLLRHIPDNSTLWSRHATETEDHD